MVYHLMNQMNSLFAQDSAPKPGTAQNLLSISFMVFFFLIAMYLFFILPKKSRDKQMKRMIDTLKKNDKVMTSSGIIGIVHSVDKESGEIVIKVDESNNTKIRFSVEAVYYIFPDKDKESEKGGNAGADKNGPQKG